MSTKHVRRPGGGGRAGSSIARVLIACETPPLRVSAYADGPARIEGGYGGWELVARARDHAFTEWRGVEPRSMSLPILLDGFADDDDQEPFVDNLQRMAWPSGRAGGQPPTVTVRGAVPAPAHVPWVITAIDWRDPVIRRRRDGHRVRQGATLSLLEHVDPELAFTRDAAQRGALSSRTLAAREGDTLSKIASRELGDASRWTEIRDLTRTIVFEDGSVQEISSDPRRRLKEGFLVRLPSR